MRYQKDPERRRVAERIEAEIGRARAAESAGDWITYLIRDPRWPDRLGNAAGTPIYVGQSKEFGKRVRSRFARCEREATAQDSIGRRVADLLSLGFVPRYEVLDRCPTRLTSLISETNWARRCIARGYDLANLLPEQRRAGPMISRTGVPHSWVWPFLLSEAIEDDIRFKLRCRACSRFLTLEPVMFLKRSPEPRSLYDIRIDPMWQTEPCTFCGALGTRSVRLDLGGSTSTGE